MKENMLRAHALVTARCARAQIRVAAMVAENDNRDRHGLAQAYDEASIVSVIDEESIGENAVLHELNW